MTIPSIAVPSQSYTHVGCHKLAKPMMGNKSLKLTGKMIGIDVERVLPAIFASLSKEKIQEALKQTK